MRPLLILVLAIFSANSFAKDDESLKQFWQDYIGAYGVYLNAEQNRDIATVIEHFAEPSMQVPPSGKARVSKTHHELAKFFTPFLGMLEKRGVARLEWEKTQIVKLTDNSALASNIARALDANGAVVDRFSSVYSLIRSEEEWKIAMIQSHSVDKVPVLKN